MSKPGSSYSSSRLDLTGENVGELTKGIATSQPVLAWLHSSEALALYNDPYINGVLSDPVGAVAGIYAMTDPEGQPIGQQYLNKLFSAELGRDVEPEDFIMIGAQLFSWLEKKITGFRGLEMVRYLSAADSAEKLIAGSLIKEATEAMDKHRKQDREDVEPEDQPKPIRDQLEEMKKNQPELYDLLLGQLKTATKGGDRLPRYAPLSQPVLGETESREPSEELEPAEGHRLSDWIKARSRTRGIFEMLGRLRRGKP